MNLAFVLVPINILLIFASSRSNNNHHSQSTCGVSSLVLFTDFYFIFTIIL